MYDLTIERTNGNRADLKIAYTFRGREDRDLFIKDLYVFLETFGIEHNFRFIFSDPRPFTKDIVEMYGLDVA